MNLDVSSVSKRVIIRTSMSISYSAFHPWFAKLVGAQITTLTPNDALLLRIQVSNHSACIFQISPHSPWKRKKVNIFQLELPLH